MGKLKDPAVNAIIKDNLAYGKPTRVRLGALKAIKGRGAVLEEEVQLLKEMILHDKEFRMRLFALSEIVRHFGDRRFAEAVKTASETDRDPRVRRMALETFYELNASLESSAALSKLRGEVEELKEENRRLAKPSA